MLVNVSWPKTGSHFTVNSCLAKYSIHNVFICLSSPDAPVDWVDLFCDDGGYYIHRKRYMYFKIRLPQTMKQLHGNRNSLEHT